MLELDHVGFSYGKTSDFRQCERIIRRRFDNGNNGTFRLRKDHFAAFDGRFFTTRHWLRHH